MKKAAKSSPKIPGRAPDPVVARRRQRVLALFEAGMKPKQMLEPMRREFGRHISGPTVNNDIRQLRVNGALKRKRDTWDDEMDRRCLALKQAGNSYDAIARVLRVSRSAVAGRLHRLRRENPTDMGQPKQSVDEPQNNPGGRRSKRPRRSSSATKCRRPAVDASVRAQRPAAALQASSSPYPPGALTAVMTAKPGTCRWPIGEPRAADFSFCGAKALDGSSCCADCAARAWPTGGGAS